MYNPVSTIRIQFHKGFTFDDFEGLIPFFSSLGVGTIYASPIFHAVEGSNHGYDVVDPHVINPEIGTIDQFKRIIEVLKKNGIGWIQDIVPNHMAFHSSNHMLMDVLEKGPGSEYAGYFDTSLASDFFQSRLMIPVLDGSLDEVILKGELKIVGEEKLFFEYNAARFPLNSETKTLIRDNIDADLIRQIAGVQYYELCDWRRSNIAINYRRFFTVNSLICLNMQSDKVFGNYHSFIRTLLKNNLIDGLRVDHVDGLFDPEGYMQRLRDLAGQDTYIIIEKILESGEKLPTTWPVQGTSGYEFLAAVNNLFTRTQSERSFNNFYNSIITNVKSFEERVREKKSLVLFQNMAGELDNLTTYFVQLDLGPDDELLKNTIASFLINCPQYRFYGNHFPLTKPERQMIDDVLDEVRMEKAFRTNYTLLHDAFVEKPGEGDEDYNRRAALFYQRLMQFTGPLMAKGVEDTLMYTFNRFVGHNEVGDSPEEFGTSVKSFHAAMIERQRDWPLALSATSTHDTKRGEDARMRLNVLTDLADEWLDLARHWLSIDIKNFSGKIDDAEKYFIYQTLIGCYPADGNTSDLISRLDDYFIKAFREAKRHTGWNDPDNQFEKSVQGYVHSLLTDQTFTERFVPFQKKVSDFGMLNSLSQLVLKMTCPGVPDIYQASLNWDLSLVDPDNRRPVDYGNLLHLINADANQETLWQTREDGHIKVWLAQKLLQLRKENANLFLTGEYVALKVTGKNHEYIMPFARQNHDECIVVIVPLHLARVVDHANDLRSIDWSKTFVELPIGVSSQWTDDLENKKGSHNGKVCVDDVFGVLPIAVLRFQRQTTTRKAGVLLPVSSLPSSIHVGDLGPAARSFADFLFRSGQKVWQMLPLNTTDETVGFSPYSSYSSIAGNPLLISLEDLVKENLLSAEDIPTTKRTGSVCNFEAAYKMKTHLLSKAWKKFKADKPVSMTDDFEQFVLREARWLNDFALFEWIFRHERKPWFEWPAALCNRDRTALETIERENHDDIQKIKWIQFIFFRQVTSLKKYCNTRGISLMGDLPFYISHNSADVWIHRNLFEIDDDGSMNGVAGVPPDYFNDQGQLWGMPVYRWDRIKDDGYKWWTYRIKKNMEIYDSIRLDHFRAFAKFWRVPKGESTAVNGDWINGPGLDLFNTLKKELGDIHFVAEDLGDVDEEVFKLRDDLGLPGMKVLQFAFGDDYPESIHLPHHHTRNFVVYSGTHDNNTSRGWYDKEIPDSNRKNLQKYSGSISVKKASQLLIRMAYASVANTAIIPMQDILDLPQSARMNTPSGINGNWVWRMKAIPDHKVEEALNDIRRTFDR